MSNIEALGGQFDQSLVALNEHEREAFPHVIFQQESDAAVYKVILATALEAAREAGLPVVADITLDEETGRNETVIRSSSADHLGRPSRTESALFHGAAAIVERTLFALSSEGVGAEEAVRTAREEASQALHQITDNSELSEAFGEYYGGLRWGSDQEGFTQALFEHAAELDLEFLNQHITDGSQIRHVIYDLDIELPSERSSLDLYEMSAEEILAEIPEVDYRKLSDPEFAASEAGQRLAEGYRKLRGYEMGQSYKHFPRPIAEDGNVVPKPIIPLSKFPIIEALMIEEASLSRPKMKYDMGPREVTSFILNSDSLPAQQSIVESVTRRLPSEHRHAFDGPDEFVHKLGVIRELTNAYMNEMDPNRQAQFKDQLLSVFEAYTRDGAIAEEMRDQYWDEERRGIDWHRDVSDMQNIVKHLLTAGLASPDAQDFIGRYMPDFEKGLAVESDPLALSRHEMILITLDALNSVNARSNPAIFEHVGRKIFSSDTAAQTLREIAELNKAAAELWNAPEVKLAIRAREKFSFLSLDDRKTNPDSLAADEALEAAQAPSKSKSETARLLFNQLILDHLTSMTEEDVLRGDDRENRWFFEQLVDRVSYGETWHLRELPEAHLNLMGLAKHPNVPAELRASIIWKFSEKVKYADTESAPLLLSVVFDGYKVMLGDPENIRIPGPDTGHGLAAINFLAGSNRTIFEHASDIQLMTLGRYKAGIVAMAERVTAGLLTDGPEQPEKNQTLQEWQIEVLDNLKRVMKEMNQLEKHYQEYLHFEEVKIKPHVFYPWLLQSFIPFWQRLQREAGPNSSDWQPSTELKQLYSVMKDHVDNELVFQDGGEYPEDFDIIEDGGLGSLIHEGYRRMVVPHDIKYNNVVYHDGLSFMHAAVVYMPESAIRQLKAKYADHTDFIDYIDKNRARWNNQAS